MKTRDRDPKPAHGLPPPPAPPARDANPWTISHTGSPGSDALPGAARSVPGGSGPAAARRPRFPVRQVPQPKPRKPSIVPLAIFAIAVLIPLGAAVRALGAGALAEAIGPLFALLFIAFIAIRILRRRRS